jgi:hypothetical protein
MEGSGNLDPDHTIMTDLDPGGPKTYNQLIRIHSTGYECILENVVVFKKLTVNVLDHA